MKTVRIGSLLVGRAPVLLCSVVEEDVRATLSAVRASMRAGADCIELRIDRLSSNALVKQAVRKVRAPKLVVCRPLQLDGFFRGTEDERVARLLVALESGADALDVELTTSPARRARVIHATKAASVPLVICYENFARTPPRNRLLDILTKAVDLGADIAKFAVTANSYHDMLTVLSVTLEAHRVLRVPFVAIAMGAYGSASRPLACVLGSAMTYCAYARGKEGAPGQLPVKATRQIIRWLAPPSGQRVAGA